MAGLVPAIPVSLKLAVIASEAKQSRSQAETTTGLACRFAPQNNKDVDARDKPGHDFVSKIKAVSRSSYLSSPFSLK